MQDSSGANGLMWAVTLAFFPMFLIALLAGTSLPLLIVLLCGWTLPLIALLSGHRIASFLLRNVALRNSNWKRPQEEESPESCFQVEPLLQVCYPEPAYPSIPPRLTLPVTSPSLRALKQAKELSPALPVTPLPSTVLAQAVLKRIKARLQADEPPQTQMREPVSFLLTLEEEQNPLPSIPAEGVIGTRAIVTEPALSTEIPLAPGADPINRSSQEPHVIPQEVSQTDKSEALALQYAQSLLLSTTMEIVSTRRGSDQGER